MAGDGEEQRGRVRARMDDDLANCKEDNSGGARLARVIGQADDWRERKESSGASMPSQGTTGDECAGRTACEGSRRMVGEGAGRTAGDGARRTAGEGAGLAGEVLTGEDGDAARMASRVESLRSQVRGEERLLANEWN
jgi:hypothetical protein